jgi:AcrR family transcriptional regulator
MDSVEVVKGKRRYDSSRRQEQARQTRRVILQAAYDLFVEVGYGQATIAAIAERAGVSVETIYSAFSSKATLLRRVWDVTVGGDDEDIALHERPPFLEMRAEQDLRRRLERMAALLTQMSERTVPFLFALQGAAAVEPAAAAMVEQMDRQRLNGITIMAREAAQTGQLTVSEEECRDVLWSTNRGELWHLLVVKRGWEPQRFERWIAELWKSLLT